MDFAGFFINEVVVKFDVRIEDGGTFGEDITAQQPFFHEEIECVVHGGAGNGGMFPLDLGPDLIGGGVRFSVEHIGGNGEALGSGLDLALS